MMIALAWWQQRSDNMCTLSSCRHKINSFLSASMLEHAIVHLFLSRPIHQLRPYIQKVKNFLLFRPKNYRIILGQLLQGAGCIGQIIKSCRVSRGSRQLPFSSLRFAKQMRFFRDRSIINHHVISWHAIINQFERIANCLACHFALTKQRIGCPVYFWRLTSEAFNGLPSSCHLVACQHKYWTDIQ